MDKTVGVSGRVDICAFATLVKGYEEKGVHLRSKSDVMWQAVEDLARVVEKMGIQRFTDVVEAIDYLERANLSLGTNARALRSLWVAQQRQVAEEDFGVESFGQRTTKKMLLEAQSQEDEDKMMYETAAAFMRREGMSVPTFAQFLERKKKRENETVMEIVDEAEFAAREAERLRELKEGLTYVPPMK